MNIIYMISRIASILFVVGLATLVNWAALLLMPLFWYINEKAIRLYDRYESLTFYSSLTNDDKEALDWYL